MIANYKPFVDRLIQRYEGGYGWNQHDSGGPTKYGITCYDLAEHRHQKMTSMETWAPIVRAMPLSEAEDIYASKYAVQCRFDELDDGRDVAIFDFAVNSGSSRAIKFAQQVVGVSVDGILGEVSLVAVNDYDSINFINRLCDARLSFLRHLGIWSTFGRGWSVRVDDVRHYALNLLQIHKHIIGPMAKAYEQEVV